MVCYFPLKAYRSPIKTVNGKSSIVFKPKDGAYVDRPLELPCGQCVGCRLEHSRQWAVRCMHEASLHEHNSFITLTYSEENLPENGTLVLEDFQKFMKRLRKKFSWLVPGKGKRKRRVYPALKFYHCGEYGDINGRPHYHACLFGIDFPDKVYWRMSRSGFKLYRSPMLEELWKFGNSEIGDVTFESAAYCARYVMKKITGDMADDHYKGRKPEYTTMSRRPGLGQGWYLKYKQELINNDGVLVNGHLTKPPRFYRGQFELENAHNQRRLAQNKSKRIKRVNSIPAEERSADNSRRALAKLEVLNARISKLKREVD